MLEQHIVETVNIILDTDNNEELFDDVIVPIIQMIHKSNDEEIPFQSEEEIDEYVKDQHDEYVLGLFKSYCEKYPGTFSIEDLD